MGLKKKQLFELTPFFEAEKSKNNDEVSEVII